MDRLFKYELDGEEMGVRQKDLPSFKAKGILAKAEPLRAFEVDGEPVYVRKRDIDKFRIKNAQAPELVELDDGSEESRYVRRADREAFISKLSGDEQVQVARQLLPTSKYAKNAQGSMAGAIAKGAGEGLVQGVRDLGVTAAKAVVGVPETVVGAADVLEAASPGGMIRMAGQAARGVPVTTGEVGKLAERAGVDFEATQAALGTLYTDEQKQALKNVEDAKGVAGTVRALVKNPMVPVHSALESLPAMALGATGAGPLAKAGMAPELAGAVMEGLTTAGQMQERIRQGEESGYTTPAQTALAAGAGAVTTAIGYGTGKVAGELGIVDPETLAAGGARVAAKKPLAMAPRVALGVLQEGPIEEGTQSVQEQMFQNAATGRPIMEGTKKAGVLGTAVGSVMGGVANVIVNKGAEGTEGTKAGPPPIPDYVPPVGPTILQNPSSEMPIPEDVPGRMTLMVDPSIPANTVASKERAAAEAQAAAAQAPGAQAPAVEPARNVIEDRKEKWNKLVDGVNNETITPEEFVNGIVELANSIEDVGLTPERFKALPEATKKRVVNDVEQELKANFNNAQAQADNPSDAEREAMKDPPADNVKPSRALKKVVEDLDGLSEENVAQFSNPALRKAASKLKEQADSARRSQDYDTAKKLDAKRKMIYQAVDRKARKSERQEEAWRSIKREQIRGSLKDFINTMDEGSYPILRHLANNGPYFVKPADVGEVFVNGIPNKNSGVGFNLLSRISRDERTLLFKPRPDGEVGGFDSVGEFGKLVFPKNSGKWEDTNGSEEFIQQFRDEMDAFYGWQSEEEKAYQKIQDETDPVKRERLMQARKVAKEAGPKEAEAFLDQLDQADAEQSAWDKVSPEDMNAALEATAKEMALVTVEDAFAGLASFPSEAGDVVTLDGMEFTVVSVDEDGTMVLANEDAGMMLEYGNEKVEARYERVRQEGSEGVREPAQDSGKAQADAGSRPGGKEGFGLDGGTAEEIAAEQRRAAQRAEMERRQNQPLDGRGAAGMDQPGLPGIDTDTPLFNQQRELFNVAEGPVGGTESGVRLVETGLSSMRDKDFRDLGGMPSDSRAQEMVVDEIILRIPNGTYSANDAQGRGSPSVKKFVEEVLGVPVDPEFIKKRVRNLSFKYPKSVKSSFTLGLEEVVMSNFSEKGDVRYNVSPSTPEMFAPGGAGQGGGAATGGGMRDAAQGAAGGKLDGKPRLGTMEADLVEFATVLLGGKVPRVVKKLRGLNGTAAGAFRVSEDGKVSIDIRADQALVVSNEERLEILRKAQQITELEMGADAAGTDEVAFATRRQQLIKQMLNDAFSRNIVRDRPALLRVLAHEAAHALDFMPDGTLKRGNIFGHIAALSNYTKKSMGMDPRSPGPLTEDEKKEMMKRARREVGQGKERVIIEEIVREVPEYKIVGVKPSDVTSLLGTEAGKATPELYAWFASQDTQTKKEILKAAIKGAVDSRLDQFGKKVQTGTRIEKETKTTTFKPTEEDVRKRFRELLKEEVTARRLAELAVVKKELEGLIAWYNNAEEMPEYYQEPAEMFAEAFSAWLNYPGEVETRAPIFNGMMEEWIAERPEAYKEYQAVQKKLAEPNESSNEHWRRKREAMADTSKRNFEASEKAKRFTKGERKDQIAAMFLRVMDPVYSRVRKLTDKTQMGETVLALAKMRNSGAAQEISCGLWKARVLDPLRKAGISLEEYNEYLFALRVAKEGVETMVNDARDRGRANMANPGGSNARGAEARLSELRLNPERYAVLEAVQQEMWKIRKETLIPVLQRTEAVSPEQYATIAENWAYAKFAVDQTGKKSQLELMMDGSFGPGSGLHSQHGTFQQIGGPAENTLLADISLWQWALAQDAKWKSLTAVAQVDPKNINPAKYTIRDGRRVYQDVNTPRVKTVYYTRRNVLFAFNVPTSIAHALGRSSEGMTDSITSWVATFITGQAQVLTTANLAFGVRNPRRDFRRASKLLPGWITLPLVGNPVLLYHVLANTRPAIRRRFGRLDEQAIKGLERGMLVRNGSYSSDSFYGQDTSTARELRKAGIKTPKAVLNTALRAAEFVWDAWGYLTGTLAVSETMVKLGAMDYLDAGHFGYDFRKKSKKTLPEWRKQWMVEKLAGTPAVLEHSGFGSNPWARIFALYYNIKKEGMLGDLEVMKDRPAEYAFKTATSSLPQIIQYGAIFGLFSGFFKILADAIGGKEDDDDETNAKYDEESKAKAAHLRETAAVIEDYENMQRSIPFRDRLLYNALAFAWDDKKNGKAAYFIFPDDDIAAAQKALMFGGFDVAAGRISAAQMWDMGVGGQLPNTSPIAAAIFSVATNLDPSFGFRKIADRDAPLWEQAQEHAKLLWNNMTGSTLGLYRIQPEKRLGDSEPGKIEAWLNEPGHQLFKSFVRVSNAGLKDEMRVEDMMMKREDYTERTAMDEIVSANIAGREAAPAALEMANAMMPDRRDRLLEERISKLGLKDMDIWKRRAYELPDEEQELRGKAIQRSEALGK